MTAADDPTDDVTVRETIELTDAARRWVEQEIPAARRGPLETAVRKATSEELAAILDGPATLARLLPGAEPRSRDG